MKKEVLILSVLLVLASIAMFVPKIFAQSSFFTYQFAANTVDVTVGMKNQYRNGVYDGISNTTYIVYPSGTTGQYSAANPYIIAYNHKTHTWSNEMLLDTTHAATHDNHNYPQVLMDTNGYIHVFSFGHATPVVHLTSVNPRDISSWNKVTLNLPDGNAATYPAAYKAKNGDMYIFFRETLLQWHEPEMVIKSTDNGKTWAIQRVIDPLHNADIWNTTYVKTVYYSPDPEGIHITFGFHKNHNDYFNKHYYVFFSFADNHVYSAAGRDFGPTIDRTEAESCAECLILDYGRDMSSATAVQTISVSLDKDNSPIVYYTYLNPAASISQGILHIKKWNKTTKTWLDAAYPQLGDIIGVTNTEYNPFTNITDLYIRVWEGSIAPSYIYLFDGSNLNKTQLVSNYTNKIHFTSDYHPELKMSYGGYDIYTSWQNAMPTGTRVAAGERDFSLLNACSVSGYYTNIVWSGNSYFQYPITAPCSEYSIGSELQSNGELYSPLIPVQQNVPYKISYAVKTENLTSVSALYPGSIVVSEYNSTAQNSDPLTANRNHDGKRATVPVVTGSTDWVSKSYTFTTATGSGYVRLRLMNGGYGEAKGRVYFKDAKFMKYLSGDIWGPAGIPDGLVDMYDFIKMRADFRNPYTLYNYNDLVGNFGK